MDGATFHTSIPYSQQLILIYLKLNKSVSTNPFFANILLSSKNTKIIQIVSCDLLFRTHSASCTER